MNGLQVTIVILSSVTLAVGATHVFPPTTQATELPETTSTLAPLEARIAAIEERSRETPPALSASAAPLQRESVPSAPEFTRTEYQAFLRRLGELEARLANLERELGRPLATSRAEPRAEPRARPKPEELRQTILDPQATVADKLRAHKALRHVKDSYDPAAVQELIRIGQTSESAATRADVWRQFDGDTRLPGIVPAMLNALSGDTDKNVREEAAETLAKYWDDPSVQQALTYSATHDPDEGVRQQASQVLAKRRR